MGPRLQKNVPNHHTSKTSKKGFTAFVQKLLRTTKGQENSEYDTLVPSFSHIIRPDLFLSPHITIEAVGDHSGWACGRNLLMTGNPGDANLGLSQQCPTLTLRAIDTCPDRKCWRVSSGVKHYQERKLCCPRLNREQTTEHLASRSGTKALRSTAGRYTRPPQLRPVC